MKGILNGILMYSLMIFAFISGLLSKLSIAKSENQNRFRIDPLTEEKYTSDELDVANTLLTMKSHTDSLVGQVNANALAPVANPNKKRRYGQFKHPKTLPGDYDAFHQYVTSLPRQDTIAASSSSTSDVQSRPQQVAGHVLQSGNGRDIEHPIRTTSKAPADKIKKDKTRNSMIIEGMKQLNLMNFDAHYIQVPDDLEKVVEGETVVARLGGNKDNLGYMWISGEIIKRNPSSGTFDIRYFPRLGKYKTWYIETETDVPSDRIIFFQVRGADEEKKIQYLNNCRENGLLFRLHQTHDN